MKIARLLVLSTIAANAVAGTVDVPRAPLYREMPLPDEGNVRRDRFGDLSWIAAVPVSGTPGSKTDCWQWGLVVRHWNPATGDTSQRSLGLPGGMEFQLVAGRGTWFRSTTTCNDGAPVRIGLMTPENLMALSVPEAEGLRMERFVALSDDAIFAIQRDPSSLHPRGVVFRREGTRLVAQAMPELPVRYRGDYAIVALDDHRVMLLGGSDSNMRGCNGCRPSTRILDTRALQWTSGPSMREGRSEATAARLPDGSVVVAGGWTVADFWGVGPSRTAERWDPQRNVFEPLPPMPVGIARAQARWMPGRDGGTRWFVQGVSAGIPAFDVKTRSWYLAGAWTAGSIEAACAFFPFEKDGRMWAWQRFRTEGPYETMECASDRISLARMIESRPPGGTASGPPAAEVGTGQAEARFVPVDGSHPALVVGGAMSIGANQVADSGAVVGVDPQGRLFGLPALNHARRVPEVVRIGDGVLVTGGSNDTPARRESPPLPPEWLASTERGLQVHWQDLSDTGLVPGAAVAPARDGGLIEISPLGQLARLRPRAGSPAGSLAFDRKPVAWLDPRRSTQESPVVARELADGRVVVAGGEVRRDRIALWSREVEQADVPDSYAATGAPSPGQRPEIVAPDGRVTRLPAPSKAGAAVVILEDGRVVTAHAADGDGPPSFEMADPSTKRWTALPAPPGDLARGQRWHLAAAGNDLLLAGDTTARASYRSQRAVWRLDIDGHCWDTSWREVASDPAHPDIPVVRDLVVVALPGGRHEIVALEAP